MKRSILLPGISLVALAFAVMVGLGGIILTQSRHDDYAYFSPTPSSVNSLWTLVRQSRSSIEEQEYKLFEISERDLNDYFSIVSTVFPGIVANAFVQEHRLTVSSSIKASNLMGGRWIDIDFSVVESGGDLSISELSLGKINAGFIRRFVDGRLKVITKNLGATAQMERDNVRFELDPPERIPPQVDNAHPNRRAFPLRSAVYSLVRIALQLPSPKDVEGMSRKIIEELESGNLSTEGSVIPHLKYALALPSKQLSGPSGFMNTDKRILRTALLAITQVCGSHMVRPFIPLILDPSGASQNFSNIELCDDVTINGRIDAKKHFLTSMALNSFFGSHASNALGDLKELLDMDRGRLQDFFDISANSSGILLSSILMCLPKDEWSDALESLRADGDILFSRSNVPDRMTWMEFSQRFGSSNGDAYKSQTAEIHKQLNELDFFKSVASIAYPPCVNAR